MNSSEIKKWLCAVGFTGVLAACGGGSSSSSSATTTASLPNPTQQVAKGTVTGFGSVYVNGVEWETDDCDLTIDDEVGDESQLKVGNIVEVQGSIDENGIARCDSMEFDSELEGQITEVGANYILVYSLRVEINDDTVFDDDLPNRNIGDLNVGDYVEVSAFTVADGYVATRIDVEVDDGEVEIYGKVENLDTGRNTFMIHEMTVNYASAAFEDFGSRDIEEGDYVEVEGDSFNVDEELVATSVEYKDNNPYDDGDEGDEFEVEGFLSVVDGNPLMLNDFTITLADNVEYEYGTSEDLVDGAKVEVEGTINAAGELVVNEVKFKIESDIEIKAPLDAIPTQDADSGEWHISLLGRNILVTDQTQFEDSSEIEDTYFNITDIAENDWLEVKVFENDTGDFIAVRIEREDASDLVEIEGPLSAIAGDELTVAGFTVIVDVQTSVPEGQTLESFLDSLEPGASEVEVEGMWSEGTIMAFELELDD